MICKVMVVLPEDSGPKTSVTRPRGIPPTPSAASKLMEPVEITAIGTSASLEPSRTIDPLPNCFSICARASSTALLRSSAIAMGAPPALRASSPSRKGEKNQRRGRRFDGIVAGQDSLMIGKNGEEMVKVDELDRKSVVEGKRVD